MSRRNLPVALYKEITYAQLRSFSEMARLGNMTAAAKSLRLSHPTIWKQIRSLEDRLGQSLLEVNGRRCDLTPAGRALADMVAALVAEFETLPDRFVQHFETVSSRLVVASASRICVEDMPCVIKEFRRRLPDCNLKICEAFEDERGRYLMTGEADIVLGALGDVAPRREIVSEPCFEIEPVVVMPEGHPLSSRRRITLEDIARYPLLNRPDGYPDEEVWAALKAAGAFDKSESVYSLVNAASIRSCTRLGYGIGIVGRVLQDRTIPGLIERSLSHLFRPITVYAFSIHRLSPNPSVTEFISTSRELLKRKNSTKAAAKK